MERDPDGGAASTSRWPARELPTRSRARAKGTGGEVRRGARGGRGPWRSTSLTRTASSPRSAVRRSSRNPASISTEPPRTRAIRSSDVPRLGRMWRLPGRSVPRAGLRGGSREGAPSLCVGVGARAQEWVVPTEMLPRRGSGERHIHLPRRLLASPSLERSRTCG